MLHCIDIFVTSINHIVVGSAVFLNKGTPLEKEPHKKLYDKWPII
jgi:hypothetical protein